MVFSLERSRLLGGVLLCIIGSSLYLCSLCRQPRTEMRTYTKLSGPWAIRLRREATESRSLSEDEERYSPETAGLNVPDRLDVGTDEQEAFPGEASSDSSSQGRSGLEADAENDTDVVYWERIHPENNNTLESATDGMDQGRTDSQSVSSPKDVASASAEPTHSSDPPPVPAYNTHCAIPVNDSKLPMCPFCKSTTFDSISIYLEEIEYLDLTYENSYTQREKQYPEVCKMPDGIKCILQHTDTMADVVFRMQWFLRDQLPVRYCYPQILSILNSEAERPGYQNRPHVKHAEVHIDFHIASEVLIAEGCRMKTYQKAMASWSPPDPSEHHGVAMFLSHCREVEWRYNYIKKLMRRVRVDMHGACFHNVAGVPDRDEKQYDREASFIAKVKRYRAVLVFENHRQESYISEKIFLALSANGVIPIYYGAPDVHMWLPGNHTYVDATQYDTPEALADYIKLILSNDTVYEYHTTNYNTQKVLDFLGQHCPPEDDYICHLCRHAYKLKRDSFHNGTRHCTCTGAKPAATASISRN